jgi:hypothetical protein
MSLNSWHKVLVAKQINNSNTPIKRLKCLYDKFIVLNLLKLNYKT